MDGTHARPEAVVTTLRWRSESGDPFTTLVAKVTQGFDGSGALAWVKPSPLVTFDRVATDGRFVAEASELAPWTAVACVVPYGGPLRFSIEGERGETAFAMASAPNGAAGFSMASPERAYLAPTRPARGTDGLMTISDDVDGRYFVASPPAWQLPAVRGSEPFLLELTGFRAHARFPGLAVLVTAQQGGRQRTVALTYDMIVIDGAARQVSLVGRALLHGEAVVLSHTLVLLGQAAGSDLGDTRVRGMAAEATRDLSATDLAMLANSPPSSPRSPVQDDGLDAFGIPIPATPFDPGFAPAPVVPAAGVAETLMPVDSLEQQLAALRAQLKKDAAG